MKKSPISPSGCFLRWLLLIVAVPLISFGSIGRASAATITNDSFFKDTSGNPIYSQGGGVFKFGSKWYWYGVKYNGAVTYYNNPAAGKNGDTSFAAITCYSSTDLVNWTFENNIVTSSTAGFTDSTWIGRMGVVHNANTGKYVMISQWANASSAGNIFATCSTPNGNFVFNNVQYPIPGVANNTTGDQSIFTDDDGTSYLICSSSSGRSGWYVARIRLSDSLATETAVRIGGGAGREGNCMFKYNGRYYFASSDLHGWNASHCYLISSTSIQGTYSAETVMTGTDADFCHVSQTGFFITVPGTSQSTVIFCGDRWSDFAGNGFGYNQWCPLTFSGTTPTFKSLSKWDLNATTGAWSVVAGNNYILNPTAEADRVSQNVLAGWSNWTNLSGVDPCSNLSGGHTGRWAFTQTYTTSYSASTHQIITGLTNGTYTLKVWVKSSGGQPTCQIFAKSFGGTEIDASINTSLSNWTQITVSTAINVTNGQIDVGVYSVANANNWVIFDDWTLTKN